MTPSLFLSNLAAWSLQAALLVAVAHLVSWKWSPARARLWFWQGILATLLLLPAATPWTQPPPEAIPNGGIVTVTTAILQTAPPRWSVWSPETLLWILAAGTAARLLWIGLGLLRLRRLRQGARRTDGPMPALWYFSDTLTGPVTFGWLRPCVILPARTAELDPTAREAVVCHELLHVERLDWLFVLIEELIRAALWFHPLVWLTLARIQMAREQAVDEAVVARTGNREAYVEALLAVAAQRLEPDMQPAPLFLKKRHLALRVAAVVEAGVKEIAMSPRRIAARLLTASTAAAGAVVLSVWLFPMETQAQYLPDDSGITVEPGAALLHRTPLRYPRGINTGGVVMIEATLNRNGEVADAHVLSGPEELRREALSSVLQWHYDTGAGAPSSVRVAIQFQSRLAAPPPLPAPIGTRAGRLNNVEGWNGVVSGIQFSGMSPDLKRRVEDRLSVRVGQNFTPDMVDSIRGALRGVDEHLTFGVRNRTVNGQNVVELNIQLPPADLVALTAPPAQQDAAVQTRRLNIGGNVQAANLVTKVNPVYPPLAKQARIQGTVRFTATIGADGHVLDLQVVSGHPLLVESATDAVRQWIYRPTLLNGQPVEIVTQIDVNYTLSE